MGEDTEKKNQNESPQWWTDRSTAMWKRRRLIGLLLLGISIALWCFPGNVVKMIAQQKVILLGRYSVGQFIVLFVATLGLLAAARGVGWPSKKLLRGREVLFRVVAVLMVVGPGIMIVDVALRLTRTARYVQEEGENLEHWPADRAGEVIRHRPPNQKYKLTYTDKPDIARSYPNVPPGFGTVKVTLTSDSRGFRNLTDHDKYDIVCLGDSFVEGSRVDDKENWPAVLGERSGQRVFNAGMSGAGAGFYFSALRAVGLPLKPKIVICMIYGGNDFKKSEARLEGEEPAGPSAWFENSPIRLRLRRAAIRYLGPIGADNAVPETPALSWMPVAVKGQSVKNADKGTQYYAFKPKRLMRTYVKRESFLKSDDWTANAKVLTELAALCKEESIRLVFTYAASKPEVIMPLIKDDVPAVGMRAFASFSRGSLPEAEVFKKLWYERLPVLETIVKDFAKEVGAEFVSFTGSLTRAAGQGTQVFYTYDQHWTALGHVIVADVIGKYLGKK